MRLAKLFLVLCLSVDWLFSMEVSEVVNEGLLSSKVVFAEKSSNQFKTLFRGFVKKINENPVGSKLFETIKTLLAKIAGKKSINVSYLVVEESTGNNSRKTEFRHDLDFEKGKAFSETLKKIVDGKIYLHVNFDDAVKCYSPIGDSDEHFFIEAECIYKKIDLSEYKVNSQKYIRAEYRNKETFEPGNISVYPISKIYSPFYVAIAHEFIHFKHFLDTCLKLDGDIGYEKAATISSYKEVYSKAKKLIDQLPELSEINLLRNYSTCLSERNSLKKLRRAILWDSFEERRTVCGPDIDHISEMAFRIAEGLPVRYIYQGQSFFLEDPTIAENIIGQVIADVNGIFKEKKINREIKLKDVLDTLPSGFYSFGIERNSLDLGIVHSPFDIRLLLFNNDGLVEYAGISLDNNKKFVCDVLQKYRAEYLSKDVNKDSESMKVNK